MRKTWVVVMTAVLVATFTLPAKAEISFFGQSRVIPTYYSDFDFNNKGGDFPALNEGGFVSGESIRGELRLGFNASGEKWKVNMILEGDMTFDKNNGDRSFYTNATDQVNTNPGNAALLNPNAGGEFGIERVELSYTFAPWLELATGWPITAADIGSGGLLYGDDHPMIQLRGRPTENVKYELTYLSIQNLDKINVVDSSLTNDWRAYYLKVSPTFGVGAGKLTVSPIVLFSDNRQRNASVWYYGAELLGQFGMFKPYAEFIYADGEFRGTSLDISSYAYFAGLEAAVSKVFNPYVAYRFTQGDNNRNDTDVKGFVGITDIGRFTSLLGMDGNILGEHLVAPAGAVSYQSPLYSYSPDRAVGGNLYGGIGNGSSGNNPGQRLIALGSKGDISSALAYKTQVFMIWYDQVGNLTVGAGKSVTSVDKYAGTTFDLQLKYAFSKNFSATYIYSGFFPGDGIKDQLPATADDTWASVNTLQLAWAY